MLNLDKRSARIGPSFNGRRQRSGDHKVPAFDVNLEGVVLGEAEFNQLLGDARAAEVFFEAAGRGSTLAHPRFPKLASLALKEKIEGVRVTLWLVGVDRPIVLDGCNLARVTLELQDGGTVALNCQVQCVEPGDKAVSKVFDHLDSECSVQVVEAERDLVDEGAVGAAPQAA